MNRYIIQPFKSSGERMAGGFQLGPWLIQPDRNSIVRNGDVVRLTPKVMGVLVCLADHAGDAVSKETLIQTVWPDTFATDDVLKGAVSELRRAFDDDAREPSVIETIPKRGYRLLIRVEPLNHPPAPAPSTRRRAATPTKLAIVLVLAVAIVASIFYFRGRQYPIDSIAVMPFAGKGAGASDELGDGFTSGLIESLSQIPQLRVMSRSSTSRYKGQEIDPRTIGRELNVRGVLIGTLTPRGDGFVLDVELVNTSDNRHIWGQQYTGKASDVLALQTELASAVSTRLRPHIAAEVKTKLANPGTSNPEAYAFYVKGRYAADRFYEQDWKKALAYFLQAVERDPAYPQAYAGVGEAYVLLAHYRSFPLREGVQKGRAAAHRALQLDRNLAEAHCVLGAAAYIVWEFKEMEDETRHCVELNPNLSIAHQYYSFGLSTLGKMDQALAEIKRARELDPVSFTNNLFVALDYYWLRDYDRAIEESLKILEAEPNQTELRNYLARSYVMKHEYDKAAAEFEKALTLSGKENQAEALRRAYAKDRLHGLLSAQIELWSHPATPDDYDPNSVAQNYALLGDRENTFLWLDRAYAENEKLPNGNLLDTKVEPYLDNIRSDPRYQAFLRRMGFLP